MGKPSWGAAEPATASFALVMATGIVAVAAHDHDYRVISGSLEGLAEASFVALLLFTAVRLLRGHPDARRPLRDPDVALRSFTFVAACGVLAIRAPSDHPWRGWLLGAAALLGWSVLAPFAVADVRSRPRTELRDHAHGGWLLASVGTESLAVAAADLARLPGLDRAGADTLLIAALVWWILGVAVYLAVAWLIVWRAAAAPFVPDEVAPDSWILMGGLAIATLAGTRMIETTATVRSFGWLHGPSRAATLALWIAATAWIPLLLYAQMWRLDHRPGSLRYEGVWWATVFPLGMYATATYGVAMQLHVRQLQTVSQEFFWVGATAWLLVTLGLVHNALTQPSGGPKPLCSQGETFGVETIANGQPRRRMKEGSTTWRWVMSNAGTSPTSMALHPDIMALRERYDGLGATPEAQGFEGLIFLASGYAAISAWVVGFNSASSQLAVNNLIVGAALMLLTFGFAASYGRTHGLAWVAPLVGVWLIISPWAVQGTDRTTGLIVSNVVVGACVALFGLAMMALPQRQHRLSRMQRMS